MTKILKLTTPSVSKDVEGLELSNTAGGNIKLYHCLRKQFLKT